MTTWWWVRHGPTHARGMTGWTDLPADLSDAAMLQRLAGELPGDAAVVSSDLSRAVATADALQGVRSRLSHEPGLREIHFGTWEGLTAAEIATRDGDSVRRFWETPGDIAAPGGESWNALSARVSAVVARISSLHPGGHVIAVAHFAVILTEVQRALGCTAAQVLARPVPPLSLTRIGWDGASGRGQVDHRLP